MSLVPNDPDPHAYRAALQYWEANYSRVRLPNRRRQWWIRAWLVGATIAAAAFVVGWTWDPSRATQWIAGVLLVVGLLLMLALMWLDPQDDDEEAIRRHSFLLCSHCYYPLAGLEGERRCPECGQAFTPEEVERFWNDYLQCRRELERHQPPQAGN
jgi:hypothetical protein